MILVADSGSTSVDWRIIGEHQVVKVVSPGINPVYQEPLEIQSIVLKALGTYCEEVSQVWFYGAGILSQEHVTKMNSTLQVLFPKASVMVGSDLLGAAVALFGREKGMVAILGTGSNSGLYDGEKIVSNVRAGGFILGDEGSGANIGKRLLSDYIKGMIPEELSRKLEEKYYLDYPTIVENVYRGTLPSRYLAQFTYFVKEHEEDSYIGKLLDSAFSDFYLRNILQYNGYRQLELGLVGSVAVVFKDAICRCGEKYGVRVSHVDKSAADGLAAFYGLAK
ncbi:MAG: ATPase [Bacteroidales bacterium]|nr:ATPase [Bacteroidales bacterium]